MDSIVLVGGGGHSIAVIDVIEAAQAFKIYGIVDSERKKNERILGYPILGGDADLPSIYQDCQYAFVSLGQLGQGEKRKTLFTKIVDIGFTVPIVISPMAYVSKHSHIDSGSIVMHGAIINANAKIGKNCIINSKALVEHHAKVEDHTHIATGAIINGDVTVETGSFIGSNTTTKQGVNIQPNRFIKAGSVVK